MIWIWIRFGFGFGFDFDSISIRFGLILVGSGSICSGFWSILALTALIALLGGPREAPSGIPRKLPRKSYQSYKSYKSYKVHHRVWDRASSSLGANVGLDPVQNSSKSGLKPEYDDQDA